MTLRHPDSDRVVTVDFLRVSANSIVLPRHWHAAARLARCSLGRLYVLAQSLVFA